MSTPYSSDIERTGEALRFILPIFRHDWVRVGMAIKSEFGEAGRETWCTWSQQAESYNSKDAQDAWKSFKTGRGVTIATLFHMAKANGWRDDGAYQTPTPAELAQRHRQMVARAHKETARLNRLRAIAKRNALAIWAAGDCLNG